MVMWIRTEVNINGHNRKVVLFCIFCINPHTQAYTKFKTNVKKWEKWRKMKYCLHMSKNGMNNILRSGNILKK